MIQHNNYKNVNLQQILETFSHYQKINFAFYCAKDVEPFANDQRVIDCNLIVERWLKGDKTVDLITAENNAWNACDAADPDAVSYTTNAAYYAASATAAAVTAYNTDFFAPDATYYAADAKSYNIYPNDETKRNIAFTKFYKEYNQIAQNWLSLWEIPNFPKGEPDFPLFDFLQDYNLISSLLPKKRKYYHLNLNGFNIKHVNEAELLKLINTTHIKNIIRRIINNDSAQQL